MGLFADVSQVQADLFDALMSSPIFDATRYTMGTEDGGKILAYNVGPISGRLKKYLTGEDASVTFTYESLLSKLVLDLRFGKTENKLEKIKKLWDARDCDGALYNIIMPTVKDIKRIEWEEIYIIFELNLVMDQMVYQRACELIEKAEEFLKVLD